MPNITTQIRTIYIVYVIIVIFIIRIWIIPNQNITSNFVDKKNKNLGFLPGSYFREGLVQCPGPYYLEVFVYVNHKDLCTHRTVHYPKQTGFWEPVCQPIEFNCLELYRVSASHLVRGNVQEGRSHWVFSCDVFCYTYSSHCTPRFRGLDFLLFPLPHYYNI